MSKFFAVFVAIVLAACSHGTQPAASTRICPVPQGLPTGKLLLFGEMHGSAETPALISELACSLSKSEELAIGLELPSQDQPLIDSYLKGRGTETEKKALTSSAFWQKGKDGRSSAAMLQLIEDIRTLKNEGHTVALFAFDDQPSSNLERNVAIANGIKRFHASHPNMKIIALMGNIHAMREEMFIGNEVLVPSGKLLSDLNPSSIFVAYPAGTIWACMPACGIQNLDPTSSASGRTGFKEGASMGGYSHTFLLSSITASPPAVQ